MQKTKTFKRTLSLLLITLLLFSASPVLSFADNGLLNPPTCSPNFSVIPISGEAFSRSNVNLRYYPSTSAPAYSPLLPFRTPLSVTGRTYDEYGEVWYQVTPLSGELAGETGYVRHDCLDFIESGASIEPSIS